MHHISIFLPDREPDCEFFDSLNVQTRTFILERMREQELLDESKGKGNFALVMPASHLPK